MPLQQPLGHEAASHMHCPFAVLHVWPDPHAAHAAPPAPHEVADSEAYGSQFPPLQQPAHVPLPQVHVPLEHESPLPHAPQAAPPVPHSLVDCEA